MDTEGTVVNNTATVEQEEITRTDEDYDPKRSASLFLSELETSAM